MMKQRAYDTMRRAILMATLVAGSALTMAGPAAAGVFDDDEARRAIIDMREKFNTFQSSAAQRIDQNSRNLIDAQNQIETLKSEVARLRGQNEVLQNSVDTLTKQQKDYYADLDARLKKFEPQQATVEGREGTVQPGEKDEYDAALKRFQGGDFKGAGNQFSAFVKKYRSVTTRGRATCWRAWHAPTRSTRKRPMHCCKWQPTRVNRARRPPHARRWKQWLPSTRAASRPRLRKAA